ncbi:adenylyltransferase/cytidyltransferase family protein [Spirillospora sp. CA-294931]|uniref:adenylyltransferase/cytidyltransferase family protein n=1 Tax=Spirillospora sp. CA-294931 TaxID=3240042 RepID=UPI003D930B68
MRGVVGYVPGVFDLFHVGHLDVLRRAAAGCDRLVVGVLSDEAAEAAYGTRPVVPLIERLEIIANVRDVARAVPLDDPAPLAALDELGFAVLFCGHEPPLPGLDALADREVRVERFDGVAETGSAALRAALRDGSPRTSVA